MYCSYLREEKKYPFEFLLPIENVFKSNVYYFKIKDIDGTKKKHLDKHISPFEISTIVLISKGRKNIRLDRKNRIPI